MDDFLVKRVEELLQEAGASILKIYGSDRFAATLKGDFSPVTKADLLSSRVVGDGLSALFPDIPVIDEEHPVPEYHRRKSWKRFFLLDPLDGTREFIKKNDEFCINLALIENSRPVAAWIFQPVGNKGWSCVSGKGVREFGNNHPLRPAGPGDPPQVLRIITSRSSSQFRNVLIGKIGERYPVEILQMGSAIKQVYVALDHAAIYIRDRGCSEWDTAAGHLMVEEMGGEVLLWDVSNPLVYNKYSLTNPPFVMISANWKSVDFKMFIRDLLASAGRY